MANFKANIDFYTSKDFVEAQVRLKFDAGIYYILSATRMAVLAFVMVLLLDFSFTLL